MKSWPNFILAVFTMIALANFTSSCKNNESQICSSVEALSSGWKMQPVDKLKDVTDASISLTDYNDGSWYEATVPGTVLGSLASAKVVEDPYFGINMQQLDPSQFKQPWWYRKSFDLTASELKKKVSLRFNGINYRADLYVNGNKVADKETFAGTFRMFSFDISKFVREGKNTVALKMLQHADGEYSIGFVDWNPHPIDRNMGIFREVFLEINEGIKIRSPFVWSKVNKENLKDADLFIQSELINGGTESVSGILKIDYELGVVEKKIKIKPGETLSCSFSPDEFPQLSVKNVNLWWPNGMGNPNLYNIKVEFLHGRRVLDREERKYGIREVRSYLDGKKNRAFDVNGKFVLIKGGGWTDDLLLQDTRESVEAQLRYVKHMNMNSIRLEGIWGKSEDLYNLCDEYGILVMVGWSCHWEWEEYLLKPCDPKYGGAVSEEDINLLANSWFDQLMWLRNHPSIYVWMTGSDKLPAPALEKKYIELFKKYDPSRSYITSAGGAHTEDNQIVASVPLMSEISGPTGMKMLGPYDFTPPVYWFTDTLLGGGYGFNTETCPGPSIPPVASLKRMLPAGSLWPIDKKYWEFHTGRNQFTTLDRYRKALSDRYGEASGVDEFAYKAQVSNYEVMRPMFEAFVAHKPLSTGLIQWKLNSAWPELIWQLYDTYLQPNGSFYAVRKACTPLHAIYRYGFDDIYLGNEDLNDASGLTVKIRVFDLKSKEIFSGQWTGDIKTNESKFIYKLPAINGLTAVWFLDLRVYDKDNREVDNSIYWLSTKKDILDYEAAKKLSWAFYTPTKQFADYTALNQLPKVKLNFDYQFKKDSLNGDVSLKIKNPTGTIAFCLFLDLVDPATERPILPVFWADNYVTLLPGEERTYSAKYFVRNSGGGKPVVKVNGWNVDMVNFK
jgi:exo-1,4-beta-D-glucosaminidase